MVIGLKWHNSHLFLMKTIFLDIIFEITYTSTYSYQPNLLTKYFKQLLKVRFRIKDIVYIFNHYYYRPINTIQNFFFLSGEQLKITIRIIE